MFRGLIDITGEQDDGMVEAEVVAHYPLAMALHLGSFAEILSPDWLRQDIRAAALEIAERYV